MGGGGLEKNPPHFFVFGEVISAIKLLAAPVVLNFYFFFQLPLGAKPLEARGEVASWLKSKVYPNSIKRTLIVIQEKMIIIFVIEGKGKLGRKGNNKIWFGFI